MRHTCNTQQDGAKNNNEPMTQLESYNSTNIHNTNKERYGTAKGLYADDQIVPDLTHATQQLQRILVAYKVGKLFKWSSAHSAEKALFCIWFIQQTGWQ